MLGFVATKLQEFEQGKISRRRLIEVLTAAATSVGTASAAQKAPAGQPGLKIALVNQYLLHLSQFQAGWRLVFKGLQPRSSWAQG